MTGIRAGFRNPLVDGSSILPGTVTSTELADGSVVTSKLADLAVEAAKLADSSVTTTKIANLAVGTAAIADAAITDAKVDTLSADKITAGTLSAGDITVDTNLIMGGSGTFRTAPTGSDRIELTGGFAQTISWRAASGTLQASIDIDAFGDFEFSSLGSRDIEFSAGGDVLVLSSQFAVGGTIGGGGEHFVVTSARVEAMEQLRVHPGSLGDLGVAISTDLNTGIYLASADSLGIAGGGVARMTFGVQIRSDVIRNDTTSSSANMRIDATTGRMQRSTSSRSYKTAIRPWDRRASVLDLTPSLFRSKLDGDDSRRVHLGLIAEDVRDNFPIGFDAPDAVEWNAVTGGMLAELIHLDRRVSELESKQ